MSKGISVIQTWSLVTENLIINTILAFPRSGTELGSKEVREIDLSNLSGMTIFALAFCLMLSVNYIDVIIHEIGHGLASIALGGRFYGFDLGPSGAQAYFGGVGGMADKAAIASAGILSQYAVGLVCLVSLNLFRERRFVLHFLLLWMAVGNLADPSLSLLVVSRDARKIIYYVILMTGGVRVFTLMQILGIAICLLAIYISASKLKSFLLHWFSRLQPRRTQAVSILMCSIFALSLASFRLLSTWGVHMPYALLFDLPIMSNTILLVLLVRKSADKEQHRHIRVRDIIPAVAAFIFPHLILLAPYPLFIPIPTQ